MLLKPYRDLLIRYFMPHWHRSVVLAVLLLTGTGLQLITPQIVRHFIDTAQAGAAVSALLVAALLFLGVAVLAQVVAVAETYAAENLGWLATNTLRADLAEHCLELDMAFHNAHTPGELIERIDGDVSTLANFFSRFVLQLLGSGVLLVGVLVLLYREAWQVGLALTIISVVALVALNRARKAGTRYAHASRQASADLFGFLEERVGGLVDIQTSGAQGYILYRLQPLLRRHFQSSRIAFLMGSVMWSAPNTVFTLGWVLVFAMGAYFYRVGTMSVGTVYLVFQYMAMLRRPLEEFADQAQDFQTASASVSRIRGLAAIPARLADGPGVAFPDGPLSVEFRDVTFTYAAGEAQGEPVLDSISFQLQAGEVLGILGRTGSGKTTLSRLLLRLYDPAAGSIHLAGIDIRQARLADLHRRIGVVTQEVQLFQASIRDNLTLFAPGIADARIVDVLDDLGLGAWLRAFPAGLDTELAGSAGLSAGQAQLLAFARVFLHDPGVVILDEASSRLDPATERLIEHAVDRLFRPAGRRRTGMIIAHRLSTVSRADKILVLEDGRIAEYGARDVLRADAQSRFHALWTARDGAYEELLHVDD